ncbi:uncharacterized protein EV154DRAFT_492988 [Mucor mucedo]|uniref:uncharacterized protein n=1 Tax=Mucor mucedo TaxID=29922 RepID=UPI00221F8E9D|nr:uncharacterized protein EV154DRAFT_492988 [Mucor mucedo]KAI7896311.1 hypothetical protein EV154DRAFT_492988 [Mucor mucedo]
MRIFWFNTDNQQDPLTLLHDTEPTTPSRELQFPPEIIKKIVDYLPRSFLPQVAGVSQLWYATAMPILYRHLYVRTLPHWMLLVRTMTSENFKFGHCVSSLVLKPSPKLISAQLTSYLNQKVVVNDDALQPNTRGYVRLERVNFDLTGLEGIETPMNEEEEVHENYMEMDDTKKEYEWLIYVTTDQVGSVLCQCPALEYLNLSGCESLKDDIMTKLVAGKLADIHRSKPMKGIWLNLLRELTPKGIGRLCQFEQKQYKSSLNHLDLGYNIGLSNIAVKEAIQCWGRTLTHLRLDTIYEVNNETIQFMAEHCPQLRLLHITRCWNVSNPSIKALAKHCKQLKYLSLAFLNAVNEEGIRAVVQLLPELEWLNITGCGINQLFKQMILESFADYRRRHRLCPVYIQDGSVNLI